MSARQEPFEKTLDRLEAVVARLESGETSLEKGVALFKEGMTLAAACRKRLEEAKMEISLAVSGEKGGEVPFDPARRDETSLEEPGGGADVG
jgi:exodeoxyribonuclease VII small subunit